MSRLAGVQLLLLIAFVVVCDPPQLVAQDDLLAKYRDEATKKWEQDIERLEAMDQQEVDPEHAILFVGSSSIRLWESMAEDMAPWPTIRRGYGGAKMSDLAVFIERLVSPHECDAVMIFVANDVSGGDADKAPEEVLALYQNIVAKIRTTHPTQPIAFIAITPTSSRFKVWDQIQTVNRLIEEWSATQPDLYFIKTAERFMTEDGRPNDALFIEDRLHLNREGYKIWAEILKRELEKILGKPER